MKNTQTLLVIAAITFFFSACNKSDDQQRPNSTIIGKWNEVQLHVSQTINGTTTETLSKPGAFTPADYATFNENSSAIISRGGGNPADPGQAAPDIIYISRYTYGITGATLTLTSTTGGVSKTETIIKLDEKNLVLHDTYINGADEVSTDSYFVKE